MSQRKVRIEPTEGGAVRVFLDDVDISAAVQGVYINIGPGPHSTMVTLDLMPELTIDNVPAHIKTVIRELD